MRLGDEDAAVGSNQDVVRLGELRRRIARLTGRAERHQEFSLRAELQHRVALALGVGELLQFGFGCRARIDDPHVALAIDIHAVRPEDLSRAEALHDLAVGIELDDGIDVRARAHIGAAAIAGPDVFAVDVDVDRAHRSPSPSVRQRAPVAHGLVRIRQVVDRRDLGVLGRTRRTARRAGGCLRGGACASNTLETARIVKPSTHRPLRVVTIVCSSFRRPMIHRAVE